MRGTERHQALLWLIEKFCSDFIEEGNKYIEVKDKAVKLITIDIKHISGKARR